MEHNHIYLMPICKGKIRGNEERVMVARNYLAPTDVMCLLSNLFT